MTSLKPNHSSGVALLFAWCLQHGNLRGRCVRIWDNEAIPDGGVEQHHFFKSTWIANMDAWITIMDGLSKSVLCLKEGWLNMHPMQAGTKWRPLLLPPLLPLPSWSSWWLWSTCAWCVRLISAGCCSQGSPSICIGAESNSFIFTWQRD